MLDLGDGKSFVLRLLEVPASFPRLRSAEVKHHLESASLLEKLHSVPSM